jgi:membrane protease YdiL (CAAX protease family)
MNLLKVKPGLSEAIISSLALILFSFFIRAGLPLNILSIIALIFPAYLIARNTASLNDIRKITGENTSSKSIIVYTIAGLSVGLILVVLYRWHLDMPLLPAKLRSFILIAALIGCAEELVFRGYLQGTLAKLNPAFSILFSSAAHTLYKCSLFISPFGAAGIDIGFLAFWTFVIGIVYGTIRHLSGSILPSLASHALFDILVYGELAGAPWWVW